MRCGSESSGEEAWEEARGGEVDRQKKGSEGEGGSGGERCVGGASAARRRRRREAAERAAGREACEESAVLVGGGDDFLAWARAVGVAVQLEVAAVGVAVPEEGEARAVGRRQASAADVGAGRRHAAVCRGHLGWRWYRNASIAPLWGVTAQRAAPARSAIAARCAGAR